MPNPRKASVTRDSDVTTIEWPAATASLLQDHLRLAATHSSQEVNQPLFALITARKAIGDARLACRRARSLNKDRDKVAAKLDEIAKELVSLMMDFPLAIVGQPLARRKRQKVFGDE